ncbi:hypothetical protein BJ878DRAFT_477104 [Calycina marina]|uniref:Uncharacterized protein n=1 Tax=Calycina marina TaxID=1763456 RepID=A0A9P8CHW3_9HELO|nr:hypothetical protein BJ878DRAFT_477104 [Calycina marina]
MPVMPVISSSSPNEKHDSSETNYEDMRSSAMEALRSQVTNTTYTLHAQQGPGSSRAFLSSLSTLYTLPIEDFARLCASIHRASTSCDPDTPPANNTGSLSADSSKERRTESPGKGSREVKLEKFIAISREALVQLVNRHWEQLAGGLKTPQIIDCAMLTCFSSSSKKCNIRTAPKEDLRYAVRWMIFIDALGLGAVLVCGEAIAKLVYKTSGNTNDDLKWLATKIRQCRTTDLQALCGMFHVVIADLLQYYQVNHPLNKFEIMAKIQTVADGSATEGTEGWEGRASFVVGVTKWRPGMVCSMVGFNGVVLVVMSLPTQWKVSLT